MRPWGAMFRTSGAERDPAGGDPVVETVRTVGPGHNRASLLVHQRVKTNRRSYRESRRPHTIEARRGAGRLRVRVLQLAGRNFHQVTGRRPVPSVASGTPLPGTLRAHLIERGELAERRITAAELLQCPRIFLLNSARGVYPVELAKVEDSRLQHPAL